VPRAANTARVAACVGARSVQYILRVSSLDAAAASVLSVVWPLLYSGLHIHRVLSDASCSSRTFVRSFVLSGVARLLAVFQRAFSQRCGLGLAQYAFSR